MENILNNLLNIGYAMIIFTCAYLANMAFSICYNITTLNQPFEWRKMRKSFIKILIFAIGITLLCIAITLLPIFALEIGWNLPEEYTKMFQELVIIVAFLQVTCKYIKEAYSKLLSIIKPMETDRESKNTFNQNESLKIETES